MSDKAMAWARIQRTGSSSKKLVLLVLADQADDFGQVSENCTQTHIAEEAELSERQVRRLLTELSPFYERAHRPGTGGGRESDVFRLRMKERPAILGAKPRQPVNLSARATGHSQPDISVRLAATGHLPQTPSKNITLSKRVSYETPKGSLAFDALWTLWRAKDVIRRAKRKPAFETFEKLTRAGANPERILAGARAYLARPDKTRDGGQFMPDLFRWLRDEVWADFADEAAAQRIEAERIYREHGFWDPANGEPPKEVA